MTEAAAVAEPSEAEPETVRYEFGEEFQAKIVALSMRDPSFLARTTGLVRPEYLTNVGYATLFDLAATHFDKFKGPPDRATLGVLLKEAVATKKIRKDILDDVKDAVRGAFTADLSGGAFVVEKVSEFARERAVESAMLKSLELLERRDFGKIDRLMRDALLVGANEADQAYDYFATIEGRTETRLAMAAGTHAYNGITTGIAELDAILYHRGWGRKELSLIMGPAKGGKSLALGQFAQAAALSPKKYNVLLVTLEVSAPIYADRLDSALSDVAMKALKDNPHSVRSAIEKARANAGLLKIHEYPTGTLKPSQLRRLLENYRAQGIIFDLVVVDYADIMAPEYRSDNDISNFRSIYIDLRGIASEGNLAMLTATQTNREGAKKVTSSMTDVAEDFNKIRTADIVISINATQEEKDTGEARLYFAASRNTEDGFTIRIQQDRSRMKFIKKVLGRE
ncbi:AAA family ATPase [Roseospira marina]|uniref:AAA family ATPase n=1 Tax=Roseospira marina TaxID=140057 RepID=A0A5M6I5J5_9PROT|nr:DnaB-like helicase C-terminal domain-containing protein [Roseospira marina]KAA5603490.1 AAA family ATPase [Roseospira marina]MBB4315482.1 replicative DNA helicase [Roseospira marina]MBB5088372.1 replicative DNA helicase [Roseospira marina]